MFLESGYFQDGFKMFIYFLPLAYIVIKRKQIKLRYFWVLFFGLLLLFLGHLLDFTDELDVVKGVFIIGRNSPCHDMAEDFFGFTVGFALFTLGLFLEFIRNKINK